MFIVYVSFELIWTSVETITSTSHGCNGQKISLNYIFTVVPRKCDYIFQSTSDFLR